jgi:hypothetical protein
LTSFADRCAFRIDDHQRMRPSSAARHRHRLGIVDFNRVITRATFIPLPPGCLSAASHRSLLGIDDAFRRCRYVERGIQRDGEDVGHREIACAASRNDAVRP